MKTLTRSLACVSLVLLFCTGCTFADQPKTVPPPKPESTSDIVREAMSGLSPDVEGKIKVERIYGGTLKTHKDAKGKGVSATVDGDKMSDKISGVAPKVGADDVDADAGDFDKESKATGMKLPPVPWQNPLFWVGLACFGACGFCVYAQLRRAALVTGVAGAGLLAAAFYPWMLLVAVAGVVTVLLLPYIKAELEKLRSHETARAYAEAESNLTPDAKTEFKTAFNEAADPKDQMIRTAIKVADKLK